MWQQEVPAAEPCSQDGQTFLLMASVEPAEGARAHTVRIRGGFGQAQRKGPGAIAIYYDATGGRLNLNHGQTCETP
jgi:hypothetical protein